MIPAATTCYFQHNQQSFQMYDGINELLPPSTTGGSDVVDGQAQNLLYNLSVLKVKIQLLQTLVGLAVAPSTARPEPAAVATSSAQEVIQEIIVAASSMMYAFQQAELGSLDASRGAIREEEMLSHHNNHAKSCYDGSSQGTSEVIDRALHNLDASGGARKGLYANNNNIHEANYSCNNSMSSTMKASSHRRVISGNNNNNNNNKRIISIENEQTTGSASYDVIELDATDLLAKYTHYCHVCGKGFKRDANLRMHMRAHGDEYKTNSALTRPPPKELEVVMNCSVGGAAADCAVAAARKYSCPHEGCRWNRKHAKFQPLKSIICAKNHYKRSHCPKMYVCNRCNRKQFSVLSDLRTHEKHCGDTKWLCSCGTTFSRKDKLMGHVALFLGHTPVVACFEKQQKIIKGEEN